MDESPWPPEACEETMESLRFRTKTGHCHLASPRRRERIFPRQVFGLRRIIPTHRTSQSRWLQCHLGLFVPAYRCGAVPEFSRIPFSFSLRRNRGVTTISWVRHQRKYITCG